MKIQKGASLGFLGVAVLSLLAAHSPEFFRELFVYEQLSSLLHQLVDAIPGGEWQHFALWLVLTGIVAVFFYQQRPEESTKLGAKPGTNPTSSTHGDRQWHSSYGIFELAQESLEQGTLTQAQIPELLYEKLASGEWIAKGFRHPLGRDPEETTIPAAHWRIIRFNGDFTRAQGHGIKYSGIAVSKT